MTFQDRELLDSSGSHIDLTQLGMGSRIGLVPECRLRTITTIDDPAREMFAEVYARAFSEAPYCEAYTSEWIVEHVWEPHLPHCIVVAEDNNKVIALGCAHPLLESRISPSAVDYILGLKDLQFDPRKTIYMSELAVDKDFRGMGLGTKMVSSRINWALENGYEHYTLRTAAEGSHSLNLYKRIGAQELPGSHSVHSVEGGDLETGSKSRLYLWGRLADLPRTNN